MFTTLMMGRSVVDHGAAQSYSAAHGTGPGAAEPIAVVGMACRMPGGASNPESFWQFLRGGGDGVVEVPRSRMELPGPHRAGLLTGIDEFDAEFFGISPREAACLDPRHRLLLEVTWEALEHAGCRADRLPGRPVGVFVGVSHEEGVRIPSGATDRVSAHALTGGAASFAAGRLSYHLGLRGPSLAVDTATSSSLVAVHLAGQSLRCGESDLALAGGAHVLLSPYWFRVLSQARMLSPTGCCRVFDAAADGYVRGEGCGVVVLERLSDARANGRRIWAVIRGSAVNSDGRSRGITAPDPDAQADLIRAALRAADLPPERIDYVEAHGTGTPTGDPVELRALRAALGAGRDGRPLPVGSVKTNIGHLEPAAGVAGLIKAVLCVAHGEIPPHLHLDTLNPAAGTGITVPTEPTALPQGERPSVVGVSSFGASGTNAHVILESYCGAAEYVPNVPDRTAHVLALSAKSAAALAKLAERYSARLSTLDENRLADLCFTANTGRAAFAHRAAFAAGTVRGMRERLARLDSPNRLGDSPFPGSPTVGRIVFLFPDRDAAYPGMGRLLFDTAPRYRETLDEADEVLRPLLGCPLSEVLNRDDLLARPRYARPALFAVEYALARLWRQWGVEPDVLLGRGIGERVAACVRGVLDFRTGLRLAAESSAGTDGVPSGFADSVRAAVTQGAGVFLEVGPTPTLLGPVGDVAPDALLLPSLRRGSDDWQVLGDSVAALHTAGAAIDWRRFDEGRGRRLVTAPTYPFRRDRHGEARPEESVPLLGRRLQSPLPTAQFESTLAPAAHRVIDEQVVDGRPLAGVGIHLAMAVAAARESTGTAAVTIRDYELTRALWLEPDDRRRVQFVLEPDGSFQLYAAAAADPAAWDRLCLGRIASGADPSTVDIAAIRGRLTGELTADALYRRLWRRAVYLGPSARWADDIRYADGEAMSRLQPPESTVWDGTTPHPALTEAMFHTILGCLPNHPPTVTRIDRFIWHGPPTTQPLYCHCRVDPYAEQPYPTATFTLTDASGHIIAEAHRVEFRPLSRNSPAVVHNHAAHTRNAITAEPLPDTTTAEPTPAAADVRALPVGVVPVAADTRVVPEAEDARAVRVAAEARVVPDVAGAGAVPDTADTQAVPDAVESRVRARHSPVVAHDHAARTQNLVAAEPMPAAESVSDAAAAEPLPDAADTRAMPAAANAGVVSDVADAGVVPDAANTRAVPTAADSGVVPDVAGAGAMPDVANIRAVPDAVESLAGPRNSRVVHDHAARTRNEVAAEPISAAEALPDAAAAEPMPDAADTRAVPAAADSGVVPAEAAAEAMPDVADTRAVPDVVESRVGPRNSSVVHDHAARTRNAVATESVPNAEALPDVAAAEPIPVATETRAAPDAEDAGAVSAVVGAGPMPVAVDVPLVPGVAGAGVMPAVTVARAASDGAATHVAVVDTPETAMSYADVDLVRRVVFSTLARVLGVREGELDSGVALTDLGLDSWMALEAQDVLREELGVGPSLDSFLNASSITGFIADLIGAPAAEQRVAVLSAPDEDARYDPFPLTDLQHAYLVGRSTAFELGGVSTYSYVEVDIVGLDLDRLASALGVLVRRHDMLRAVVGADGTQRVLAAVPEFIVRTVDLAELSASDRAGALDRIRSELKNQVLDAGTWPLFDVRATRLDARTTRLHIGLDALVVDGWSAALLFREWATVYREGARALPELSLTFRDYLTALGERRSEQRRAEAERYWRERIAELPEAPRLPLAINPADLGVPEFTHHTTTLSTTEWAELRRLAGAHGVTPSAALCAAYSWILSAWSGTSAFTLNVMFSNRVMLHEQVDAVVGNFSTTTLLAVGLADETFARLAERIQGRLWTDLEHGDMSGVEVLREINRARGNIVGASMPVVFASMVNFASRDAAGGMTGMVHHLLGLGESATEVYSCVRTPQVWLDHQVIEEAGALVVNWDVVTGLFPDGMIETMFGAYVGLLRGLAADESAWQRPAPTLVPEADLAARRSANATGEPVDSGLLHDPFLERAGKNPHAPAVVSAEETLSYGELDRRSAKLARRLRNRGVGRGALVAVVLDKGAQQVVAVLGILRAGVGYVPVDPDVPAERLRVLLAESGVAAIVTQREVDRRTPWPVGWDRLCIDETASDGTDHEPLPECAAEPDDLAYVIFTSGSTGTPKGVMIEHRAARNTVLDINERFGIGPADRVLGLSALNFDLSVYDIFGTLAAGATLVLPESAAHREPARWADLVAEHAITVWNSVPALMEMFVDHLAAREHPPMPLRVVLLSGDWIPVTLPNRIRELAPDTVICGLGGATEAAIWSIHHRIDGVDPSRTSIPYGKPLRSQRFHVLDEAWRPCPTWVPGELYIAGAGLARGYLGDEAKTKASFVRHPTTDERLYRTGDLGRYLPDGAIEFLGRRDTQVKINGYRVELGEIEAALLRDPRVRAAAAAVVGDGQDRRLAAYAVPAATVTPDELTAALRAQLPDYLVPRHIVLLDALPLGRNGKLDRAALPRVEFFPPAPAVLVAPRDEIERTLADIWAEFFPGRDFGMDTTFFALGGNSLLAVRLMARIGAQLGPSLPLSVLFGHPTIATLADVVRAGRGRRAALVPISETGSATPWVLAHPVGGDVLCYSGLAALLGPDQPVYALQVPDTDKPLTTIPELAAHYIDALDTALPRGRYRLGGWSMGGMIALEMAARMSLRGTEIESVALIDVLEPPTPRHAAAPEDSTLLSWFARDLAGLAGTEWTPAPAELRSLPDLYDRARAAGVLPPDVDADTLSAIVTRFSRNTRALLTYRAPTYAGTVRFYRAARGATPATAAAWLARCTGDARIIDLPGDHYGIVRPPHVDALAAALRADPE